MLFSLPIVVLLPFFGAIVVALASIANRIYAAWSAIGITVLSIACLSPLAARVFDGETIIQSWAWIERAGLFFAFRLDGLSMFFALLILGIGFLVILYGRYYLSSKDHMGRFFAYILMFMGSMLGVVLSENVILLVIFWELTSLTSFLLISFWQHKNEAREGARMSLGVTAAGGLALLGGVLILGHIVGSYELSEILKSGDIVREHPLYLTTLILILIGAFAKSAQFPFHFWLPHAMAAPTPVSAYLHSATMVKAGIFLLARLFPVLSGTQEWLWIVGGIGMTTLLIGAYTAMFKTDLKGLLAYSTVSHLGLITALLGFGSKLAVVAALFHIMNHAAFKAALFMIAGAVDHETGTRDTRKLGGLIKYMPITAILAFITSAAMAGVPMLNGFLSKEMFLTESLAVSEGLLWASIVPILATIGSILAVAYSIKFVKEVFLGEASKDIPKIPHETPYGMLVPIGIFATICIAVGLFPAFMVGDLLGIVVASSLQATLPKYELALWHGVNLPLMMSMTALIVGAVVYASRTRLYRLHQRYIESINAKQYYDMLIDELFALSIYISRKFDKGSLQHASVWVIVSSIALGTIGFCMIEAPLIGDRSMLDLDLVTLLMGVGLIFVSLIMIVIHRQRIVSLVVVGFVGLAISLGFVKFSAPDLALTQLSVEIVTIILLLLALYFIPKNTPIEHNKKRIYRDIFISLLSGAGITAFTMAILTRDFSSISNFFLEQSVPGGGGTNVVNVILVDFRGFDTLGEISVLAIAGLGIFAMLKGMRLPEYTKNCSGLSWSDDPHPMIMSTLSRVLFPLMLMFAVFIFMRGHNLPGGGFIAGLIASIAITVQYLANGISWTQARLKANMHMMIGFGLLIATLAGIGSMFVGYPFLTSTVGHFDLPIVGNIHVASAIAFDLGVFLVVVGVTLMILVGIGKLGAVAESKSLDNKEIEEGA